MTDSPTSNLDVLSDLIRRERDALRAPSVLAMGFFLTSAIPLLALVTAAFLIEPRMKTPWMGAILVIGSIVLTITLFQIGSHYAKRFRGHQARIRQLEDLQVYLITVPRESWPAKELLKFALVGRQPSFGGLYESVDIEELRSRDTEQVAC